jgi:hypothetical protein
MHAVHDLVTNHMTVYVVCDVTFTCFHTFTTLPIFNAVGRHASEYLPYDANGEDFQFCSCIN